MVTVKDNGEMLFDRIAVSGFVSKKLGFAEPFIFSKLQERVIIHLFNSLENSKLTFIL